MAKRSRNRKRKSFYFYDPVKKNTNNSYGYLFSSMPEVSAEKIDIRRVDVFGQSRYWTPNANGDANAE